MENTQIAEYSVTAGALAELKGRLANIVYDCTVPAQMKQAVADRAELRGLRTSLEKLRKDIKAPALERCRLIDAEAKEITAQLEALEDPIAAQIKAEEDRRERIKAEEAAREQQRVATIHAHIEKLRQLASFDVLPSVAMVTERLAAAKAIVIEDGGLYHEFTPLAQQALADARSQLRMAFLAAQEREAEAARIEAERIELAKLREENARQQALIAQAAQEKADREAREAAELQKKQEADAPKSSAGAASQPIMPETPQPVETSASIPAADSAPAPVAAGAGLSQKVEAPPAVVDTEFASEAHAGNVEIALDVLRENGLGWQPVATWLREGGIKIFVRAEFADTNGAPLVDYGTAVWNSTLGRWNCTLGDSYSITHCMKPLPL